VAGWSEQERYFFTCKEAKYVKGQHANRATGAGYWKATGQGEACGGGGSGEGRRPGAGRAGGARAFIDFALVDAVAAGRREQQQGQQRRASSPVMSSSRLTDALHEQHAREQVCPTSGPRHI
jgi:hypothetical protein